MHLPYSVEIFSCILYIVVREDIFEHRDFWCGSLRGRAHKLVVQCQLISPENIHANNIIWTIYVYTCTHVITISGKKCQDFEKSWEGHMEGLEGGKGKRMLLLYYNLKN